MKVIPIALDSHYASGCTTLARLWKITRRDALVFGFTDHDADITYDGTTYRTTSGFDASAISSRAEMNVDNLEVLGVLDADGINSEDIEAGRWDGAAVEVIQVNWADLTMGAEILRVGEIGNVQRKRGQYVAELRGLMQKLQDNIGNIITPSCDADLGDDRCGVDLEGSPGYRVTGTVSAASSRRAFSVDGIDAASGWFDGGEITMTSGLNDGIRMEIKTHVATGSPIDSGDIELQLALPYALTPGDTLTLIPGCNKSKVECIAKFDNLLNFRGFSFVPGMDAALSIGGQ